MDRQHADQAPPRVAEQYHLVRSELLDQALGEFNRVRHDLIEGHRSQWLHCCGRLPCPPLVPLDDEKVLFESCIHVDRGYLSLARAAMDLEQDRGIDTAAHEYPLLGVAQHHRREPCDSARVSVHRPRSSR